MFRAFLLFLAAALALAVAPYVIVLAILGVLGLLGLTAVLHFARPGHPWFRVTIQYLTMARGWRSLVGAVVVGAAASGGGYLIVGGLADVAGGRHISDGLLAFFVGIGLASAPLAWLLIATRGKEMPDYLDLLGPGGLDAVKNAMKGASASGMSAPDDLADQLKKRVLGQDQIVEDVAATVTRRLRLRRKNKPVCVVMFAGATGAGKTELAKALAEALKGELIRVDCNEMTESHSVQRLIGAPPGYMGSDQPGQLTGALAKARQGVLLLDEIEKADKKVMDVLMGLLDEGRITDQSTGATVNADSFIVVMTSNAAHAEIAEIAADEPDPVARAGRVKDVLQRFFRPEQLARIDAIYPFQPLPFEARVQLVLLMLMRFAHEARVSIAPGGVDPAAVATALQAQEKVAGYGVREFQRTLEAAVMDGLLIAAEGGAKAVTIHVDAQNMIDVRPAAVGFASEMKR
jgi:DNA polymerase III delta prime subunit